MCVCLCVCVCASVGASVRTVVADSCLHSISALQALAGPKLINGASGESGRAVSAGGNVMSQWIRLTGRRSPTGAGRLYRSNPCLAPALPHSPALVQPGRRTEQFMVMQKALDVGVLRGAGGLL